jgi:hypothetical protein
MLKMSSISYWNTQPTIIYVREYPCVVGDAMPDGTTQSEQLRLLSIFDCDQQDQLAHVVYTMPLYSQTALLVIATRQPYSEYQCPADCGGGCGVD